MDNQDSIQIIRDRIMSTWKSVRNDAATGAERKPASVDNEVQEAPLKAVEITALELEVDPEIGCDPYNSTGQHLVEAIKKLESD